MEGKRQFSVSCCFEFLRHSSSGIQCPLVGWELITSTDRVRYTLRALAANADAGEVLKIISGKPALLSEEARPSHLPARH